MRFFYEIYLLITYKVEINCKVTAPKKIKIGNADDA